jgi:hypothetical protein
MLNTSKPIRLSIQSLVIIYLYYHGRILDSFLLDVLTEDFELLGPMNVVGIDLEEVTHSIDLILLSLLIMGEALQVLLDKWETFLLRFQRFNTSLDMRCLLELSHFLFTIVCHFLLELK